MHASSGESSGASFERASSTRSSRSPRRRGQRRMRFSTRAATSAMAARVGAGPSRTPRRRRRPCWRRRHQAPGRENGKAPDSGASRGRSPPVRPAASPSRSASSRATRPSRGASRHACSPGRGESAKGACRRTDSLSRRGSTALRFLTQAVCDGSSQNGVSLQPAVIAEEIEATYPGYQQIPPELGNEVVPDVAMDGALMGKATIYVSLFSYIWTWVEPK